ncbi:unnamed protein product, partial [Mesorhabditis belari]|uniref:Uncharacterized protein n=1 Tax=Mesorhabditis belari TaxID=2138241 RepID=A0AAF3FK11_9BILA
MPLEPKVIWVKMHESRDRLILDRLVEETLPKWIRPKSKQQHDVFLDSYRNSSLYESLKSSVPLIGNEFFIWKAYPGKAQINRSHQILVDGLRKINKTIPDLVTEQTGVYVGKEKIASRYEMKTTSFWHQCQLAAFQLEVRTKQKLSETNIGLIDENSSADIFISPPIDTNLYERVVRVTDPLFCICSNPIEDCYEELITKDDWLFAQPSRDFHWTVFG